MGGTGDGTPRTGLDPGAARKYAPIPISAAVRRRTTAETSFASPTDPFRPPHAGIGSMKIEYGGVATDHPVGAVGPRPR